MIEKTLDKYYIKKMKIFIDRIMIMYALDYRYIDKGDYLTLQIKKIKFNDNQYVGVFTFNKRGIFVDLCNQEELRKCIKTNIEMYDKSTREKL